VIFGLDLARDEIARRGHAVLMEGQFDVITAHGAGIQNAVASSGTALTDDQVRLLKRFTDELLLVFDADRAGRQAAQKAVLLAAAHQMRTRVATVAGAKDPDEFLRAAGANAVTQWEELAAKAPTGFEFGMEEAAAGLNLSNANHVELAARKLREWIAQFPVALQEDYRERAKRWMGVSGHLLAAEPDEKRSSGRPGAYKVGKNGLETSPAGKKMTVGRYLLQLLAVRPVAFDLVRTKITPHELDEEDRGIYERMLETYERGGVSGLEKELAGYPAEEQDLIRRAWAAPPPSVDDEVAVELAGRITLDHMRGRHSGIIRELSEAERGKDSERVARLEAEARELGHAIDEMERRG
jgi:DNA primase